MGRKPVTCRIPSTLALGLLVLGLWADPAKADSTETYTGNAYTNVQVPASAYTTSDKITAILTLANPLPADQKLAFGVGGIGTPTATDTLLDFFITDGMVTYDLSDTINIFLVTGDQGQIISWFVGACKVPCSSNINVDTQFGLPSPFTTPGLDGSVPFSNGPLLAFNFDDPGVWTTVREPSTLFVLGTGLLGLVGAMRRKLLA